MLEYEVKAMGKAHQHVYLIQLSAILIDTMNSISLQTSKLKETILLKMSRIFGMAQTSGDLNWLNLVCTPPLLFSTHNQNKNKCSNI